MATFKTKIVTKPFHLPLEDYQELFKGVKPRKNYVGIVLLEPLKNLAGIIMNTEQDEKAKFKMNEGLMKRGYMVIAMGDELPKDCSLQIGDLVGTTNPRAAIFATTKKILVKDVYPRVRKYTYMILPEYELTMAIEADTTTLIDIEIDANIDKEEEDFIKYQAELENEVEDANLFKD